MLGAGIFASYRLKKATVVDEHGFERPMPALTALVRLMISSISEEGKASLI